MKIQKIIINNFFSIGHVEIDLSGGMVLVQGDNKDSPVSDSNGAGKSSIAEAVTYALYGKTKRATNGDSVVNRTVGKDCYVEIVFDTLRVVRYRKHSSYKNEFHVFSVGEDGKEVDLTKGVNKETERMFQEMFGLSELTFNKIAYFGQGDISSFADLTDAELKQVFEQGFGLVFFSEYLDRIKTYKMELQGDMNSLGMKKIGLERDLEQCETLIEQYKESIESFREQCANQKDELNRSIKDLEKQRKEIQDRDVIGLEAYEEKLLDYNKVNDDIKQHKRALKDLHGKKVAELQKLYAKQGEAKAKFNEIKAVLANVQTAQSKIGTNCPTCGKGIVEADVIGYVEANKQKASEEREKYEAMGVVVERQHGVVNEVEEQFGELERQIERLENDLSELQDVKVKVEQVKANQQQVDNISVQIQKLTSMIGEINNRVNPYESHKSKSEGDKKRLLAELKDISEQLGKIEAELDLTSDLEDIFGNSGMKSYIFDNLTPKLNTTINHYLHMLDDIDVEITTQKELKSGEKREKFEVKVDNHHGANSYKGLSGGEKRKVDVAISLAFNAIVRELTGSDIGLLFLDEVFENLDQSSSEKVMDLLIEFSKDVDNVFVVSHNDNIKDLFTNIWTVVKHNGTSRIIF